MVPQDFCRRARNIGLGRGSRDQGGGEGRGSCCWSADDLGLSTVCFLPVTQGLLGREREDAEQWEDFPLRDD